MVTRSVRNGVEYIRIESTTLPPNIIMNRGLYPSDEVEKSYKTLNRTPVTVEHPEIDGIYVSANDPEIDMDYRFGAWNENARKMGDGRIAVDKVINVQKALKTDKGKRLLDRLAELESNENPRPIHTSVGVFVEAEALDAPMTSADGQEYSWIARNMFFDHDAILLDSVGAATPEQGTGIGVNSESVKVEHIILNDDDEHSPSNPSELTHEPEVNTMRELLINKLKELEIEVNAEISDDELLAKYSEALLPKKEEVSEEITVNAELTDQLKSQADKIADLESQLQANQDAEVAKMIEQIKDSGKYNLSDNALKAIYANSKEDFEKMLEDTKVSYGIGSTTTVDTETQDEFKVSTKLEDLPE